MKNKTYIALGICAGLLVVNTGFLLQISNRQKVLERQMENMQNQVMDSISVNTSSITQRMKNILEKQSSLLSNSNFSAKKENGAIVLLAEATPKAITNGETAEFRVKKADGSVQFQKATLENGVWKTTMETGLFDVNPFHCHFFQWRHQARRTWQRFHSPIQQHRRAKPMGRK